MFLFRLYLFAGFYVFWSVWECFFLLGLFWVVFWNVSVCFTVCWVLFWWWVEVGLGVHAFGVDREFLREKMAFDGITINSNGTLFVCFVTLTFCAFLYLF